MPSNVVDDKPNFLRDQWAGVAPGWDEHAAFVEDRGAPVTERLLDRARPRPGERVLELACGPGGTGIAAAPLVSPGGQVVLSDVAAEMTTIARRRAAARGLDDVRTRVLDLQDVDEPDASFDVVLCREGLMLAPDPGRGAREIRRLLRPGGRVALSVWGPRARNPWLGVVFDALGEQLGVPVPPPGSPHPFSLDDPDRVAALLTGAGLADVVVEELPTPYRAGSAQEWWQRTLALAGPLAQRVAGLPPGGADALRERAVEAIAAYRTADGLEIPGVCLVASARRS